MSYLRTFYHFSIKMILWLLIIFAISAWLSSCRTVENGCPDCYPPDNATVSTANVPKSDEIYILEFYEDYPKISILPKEKDNTINSAVNTLKSCTRPFLKKTKYGYTINIVEIGQDNTNELANIYRYYKDKTISLEEYRKQILPFEEKYSNVIRIKDTSEIKNISLASDVDVPPHILHLSINDCNLCPRDRSCIGDKTIFSKIEVRAMGGYRLGANESITYPGTDGGVTYPKETLGFDRGGTDITLGLEAAFLWDATSLVDGLFNIPKRHKFHLGPMIGLWPVDGSIFVPISLHPRYTFWYDETAPDKCECDAWYVFGDIGIPLDPTFGLPIFCDNCGDNNLKAYFWGFGVGRDWWMTECMDFSIDVGFRMSHTPLPANTFCEECTNTENKFPFREIGQIYLRFGLTW